MITLLSTSTRGRRRTDTGWLEGLTGTGRRRRTGAGRGKGETRKGEGRSTTAGGWGRPAMLYICPVEFALRMYLSRSDHNMKVNT